MVERRRQRRHPGRRRGGGHVMCGLGGLGGRLDGRAPWTPPTNKRIERRRPPPQERAPPERPPKPHTTHVAPVHAAAGRHDRQADTTATLGAVDSEKSAPPRPPACSNSSQTLSPPPSHHPHDADVAACPRPGRSTPRIACRASASTLDSRMLVSTGQLGLPVGHRAPLPDLKTYLRPCLCTYNRLHGRNGLGAAHLLQAGQRAAAQRTTSGLLLTCRCSRPSARSRRHRSAWWH